MSAFAVTVGLGFLVVFMLSNLYIIMIGLLGMPRHDFLQNLLLSILTTKLLKL